MSTQCDPSRGWSNLVKDRKIGPAIRALHDGPANEIGSLIVRMASLASAIHRNECEKAQDPTDSQFPDEWDPLTELTHGIEYEIVHAPSDQPNLQGKEATQ